MAFSRFCWPAILLAALGGCGTGQGPSSSGPTGSSGSASGSGAESSGSGSGAQGGSGSSASGASGGSGTGGSGGSGNSQPGSGSDNPGGADAGDAGAGGPACAASQMYPQTSFVNLAVTPGAALSQRKRPHPGRWRRAGRVEFLREGRRPVPRRLARGLLRALRERPRSSSSTSRAAAPAAAPPSAATTRPTSPPSFRGGAPTQGQTIGGSLGVLDDPAGAIRRDPGSGRTAAYSPGIFDFTNAANPFKDWNSVYVPYCTGDVHFGTADKVDHPERRPASRRCPTAVRRPLNMQQFIARIVPTFPNVTQVVLTGASAGGFGAGAQLRHGAGLVRPTYPSSCSTTPGRPSAHQYLPACMQKKWRAHWGFDAALPPDCAECFQADGSGLTNIVVLLAPEVRERAASASSRPCRTR